jgi:hypothetical protein
MIEQVAPDQAALDGIVDSLIPQPLPMSADENSLNCPPQPEHDWLAPLVGEWIAEMECHPGPGEPPSISTAKTVGRSLGGLWIVLEGTAEGPDGQPMTSLMTLGYDPARKTYCGTFIASMMTHLWVYTSGKIDAFGRKLVLDAEGPRFDQKGMANYHDFIEIVDHDHWILSSEVQGEDGRWTHFMTAHYRRVG